MGYGNPGSIRANFHLTYRYYFHMEPTMHVKFGDQEWRVNGELHRTDGPAIIWADGRQEWHVNGLPHRTDGPALIRADGAQAWYINGKLHRSGGPAVIWPDGAQEWFIDGKNITKQVNRWMEKQNITWSFDEEIQAYFSLTFG
jgi:hypothetical protein